MDQTQMNEDNNQEEIRKIINGALNENKEEIDSKIKILEEAQQNLRKIYSFQYQNLFKKCKREINNLKSISKTFEEVPISYEIDKSVDSHKRNTILDQFNVCKVLNEGSINSVIKGFEEELISFNVSNYNSVSDCIKYQFNEIEKKRCISRALEVNFKILTNEIKLFYKEINKLQLI
jgi:hypothetical protein